MANILISTQLFDYLEVEMANISISTELFDDLEVSWSYTLITKARKPNISILHLYTS
jgi:hypothetical protein